MRGVIDSDIPTGSGLSSSAALELLILNTLQTFSGLGLSLTRLAELARDAEWDFGVKSGMLDPLAIVNGHAGEVSLLDTRTLKSTPIHVDLRGNRFLIGFTRARTLMGSEYNTRRMEVEAAAAAFRAITGDETLRTLRDVTPALFEAHHAELQDPRYNPRALPLEKRARHVVSENARVLEAVRALSGGDVETFKALMGQTHASLRDDFEVSSPELNAMVEAGHAYGTKAHISVGARMMGGGFGGPVLFLVPDADVVAFEAFVSARYLAQTGSPGQFWEVSPEQGLELIPPSGWHIPAAR